MGFLKASIIQKYYDDIRYQASDNEWYLLRLRFPNCFGCSLDMDPDQIMVCLDNAEPQGPNADFQVAKIESEEGSFSLWYMKPDKSFKRVCAIEMPDEGIFAEPKQEADPNSWDFIIGKYAKISQEVKLDDIWSQIEFEGWIARIERTTDEIKLILDNGESWAVEDGELFVRNSEVVRAPVKGMAAWQRYPNRWVRNADGWERAILEPKYPGCDCGKCSMFDNALIDDVKRHEKVDVLFVGEAGGYEEARSSPPSFFVGQSGRLLRALIDQTGLNAFKVGFNNSCICYGSETPTEEDIKACHKRLMAEIEEADPKLIVAIGGIALQALTGISGITEHQGLLMDWETPYGDESPQEAQEDSTEAQELRESRSSTRDRDEDGRALQKKKVIKLLPCFHAAAVLRRPDLFYAFADSIYKAALYMRGDKNLDVQPSDITVVFANSESDLQHFREDVAEAECIYVDIETSNYNPYADRILCAGFSWRWRSTQKASRKSYVFSMEFIEQHKLIFQLIFEYKLSKYWNAFFDAQFFRQNDMKPHKVGDVMLQQYTLDESPMSQALKGTARRRCNAPDWEEPLKQYLPNRSTSYEVIPVEVLYLYNGYDAAYTGILDDIISELMDEHNWWVYNNILVPALDMFLDTCDVGMRVNTDRLSELKDELSIKMEDLRQSLANTVKEGLAARKARVEENLQDVLTKIAKPGLDTRLQTRKAELEDQLDGLTKQITAADYFNPSSIRDARLLITDVLGLRTEGSSTSRTALEDFKGIPGVDMLLQFRESRKLLGTYVEGLVDDIIFEDEKTAIVHPNIRLNGTVTGRLSSANPNFFGIPDEKGGIKKLYLARYPGWGIGDGDGAQMEVRVLGALSNDRQMISDFKTGVDFHGAARNRLYGRGFAKKNYTHQEVLDAKTAVFGPIYGRGAESLAQQFYHSELAAIKETIRKLQAEGGHEREIKSQQRILELFPTWNSLLRDGQALRIAKAQEHIDKLWEPYPTALGWLKDNVKRGQENGELMSYYGRYRHWGLVTDETMEDIKTQGRNFPVQSPSSDTNLLIMIGSYHDFSRDIYLPIFPVHDAVVFMYKLGTEHELIPQLKSYYETRAQELLKTDMKFTYEFSTGPNWGEQTTYEEKK